MPLSLSLEDGPQQFVVFQQPIHGPHPWLPQLSHFFGKQRLPQARLLMSHANHATKTIQNRIWLFWFDFVGPIPIFPSANGAVLHREVARMEEAFPMPDGLQDFLSRRAEILKQFARL